MFRWSRLPCLTGLVTLLSLSSAGPSEESADRELFRFVTRPDIRAPKWQIKFQNESAVYPGYWFVAPYETLYQTEKSGGPWIGPAIYDMSGELIWSGAPMFHHSNVEDFRISSVHGEEWITLMSQGSGKGVLLDNHFKVHDEVQVVEDPIDVNTHEFNFVDDGSRVIVVQNNRRGASEEESKAAGLKEGECYTFYDGFEVLNTATWESEFSWSSLGAIALAEATNQKGDIEERCRIGWDFFHLNSVDKTPDGDYLMSARHTDTIYKISGEDGHIIWRLGGLLSDFEMGAVNFSRQHDVRLRGQNDTHTIISILDNARGFDEQLPTSRFSRGLLLALNTAAKPMTVSIVQAFNHPLGRAWAPRRGNYQVLPNGNVFMGWSEQATQSEHLPDGTLLMRAGLVAPWLGSYRNFKFAFVGDPTDPPDVHAVANATADDSVTTHVFVSWNGATEVAHWNLYKTTPNGTAKERVASKKWTSFETLLQYDGYASHVAVEAIGKNGARLHLTKIMETIPPPNINSTAVAEEKAWITKALKEEKRPTLAWAGSAFIGILLIAGAVILVARYFAKPKSWLTVLGRLSSRRYQQVPEQEDDEYGEPLHERQKDGFSGNEEDDYGEALHEMRKDRLDGNG